MAVDLQELVGLWFEKWEEGDYHAIPVTEAFTHTSPFGTIDGKPTYLSLVDANEDQFLGYTFEIHDALYGAGTACAR